MIPTQLHQNKVEDQTKIKVMQLTENWI